MGLINTSIIRQVKQAVKEIEESLYPTMMDVFNKEADVLKGIQTDVQLFTKSQDRKGLTIHPDYADSTISIKLKKGQPTDIVTLKDTGDFYGSIEVRATSNQLIISASVEYAKYLTGKYGQDILGIQNMEMKEFFIKFIKPQIEKNISDIISRNKI